ncbi:LacI family transcriptional regulator [Lactobacillus mulieris]|uniref:LacI family DNA-binding transcriptional regulator n=1 Tax=Lactobacillus mulieris TaxID=2508708 RepID=UPI00119678A8|nr:LacI family transcriptional regulator [Lactobacillus jensenii]
MTKKFTMQDIAEIANVSKSAVSIAINQNSGISDDTRKKILKIATELGYEKSSSNLSFEKKLRTVCFFMAVEDIQQNNFFFLRDAVEKKGKQLGIKISFKLLPENKLIYQSEARCRKPSIFLATNFSSKLVKTLQAKFKYCVFFDVNLATIAANFVAMDNFQEAYSIVEYFYKKGCRKVGYLGARTLNGNFAERRYGFNSAISDFNLSFTNSDFIVGSLSNEVIDSQEIAQIRKMRNLDAFLCESNCQALRLTKELQILNFSVPNDVIVVGFTNLLDSKYRFLNTAKNQYFLDQMLNQAISQLQNMINDVNWNPQRSLVSWEFTFS